VREKHIGVLTKRQEVTSPDQERCYGGWKFNAIQTVRQETL